MSQGAELRLACPIDVKATLHLPGVVHGKAWAIASRNGNRGSRPFIRADWIGLITAAERLPVRICRRISSCLSHPCGHAREPPREGGGHARTRPPHYIGIPSPARHRQRDCSRGSPPAQQSRLKIATIRSCEPNREALSSRGSISRSHWSNVGLRRRSTAATTAGPMASIVGAHAGQQISLTVRGTSRCTEQSFRRVRAGGWPRCGGGCSRLPTRCWHAC